MIASASGRDEGIHVDEDYLGALVPGLGDISASSSYTDLVRIINHLLVFLGTRCW